MKQKSSQTQPIDEFVSYSPETKLGLKTTMRLSSFRLSTVFKERHVQSSIQHLAVVIPRGGGGGVTPINWDTGCAIF